MNSWTCKVVLAAALAWAAASPVWAQDSKSPGTAPSATAAQPPAGFTAPALPKEDDTNAARAKSQPGNNAPMWRAVRESGETPGIVNLPGLEKGVLVQRFVQYPGSKFTTAGEAWRQVRNNWIIPYGGALIVLMLVALGLFYWRSGPMGGHEEETGRKIERFTYFERAAHWSMAISFVVLAISGIVMAFGKFFMLPVLGSTLFGWLTYALKTVHNVVGPLFAVALAVFAVTYVRDNLPRAYDWVWLRKGGGMFGGEEVPSGRFNAGEKVVFWGGVIGLGLVVIGSGLFLDQLLPVVPYLRGNMQIAHLVHAAASVLMIALFSLHIYMGSVGMKGAYQAMRTGYVDEGWAKAHHELWYDDIKAGRIPAQRTQPAPPGMGTASAQP